MHNVQQNSALYIVIIGKNFNQNIIESSFNSVMLIYILGKKKINLIFIGTENAIIRERQYHTKSLRLFSKKTSILQTDIGTLKSFVEKVNFTSDYQSQQLQPWLLFSRGSSKLVYSVKQNVRFSSNTILLLQISLIFRDLRQALNRRCSGMAQKKPCTFNLHLDHEESVQWGQGQLLVISFFNC